MSSNRITALLNLIADRVQLDQVETEEAFELLMRKEATPIQKAAFLMGLRVRGESVEEMAGAVSFLRRHMIPVEVPSRAIDIVGTGGDRHDTYNISTCSAIVAASAGACVAKHGNRSVSSQSGASDVLSALGVKLNVPPVIVARCVNRFGLCFMWAPMHHPAMKSWAPIRADLGVPSLFNLIGPLCNPAKVKRQLVGVADRKWMEPVVRVLEKIGSQCAWVVHGGDGMDELTTTGSSWVVQLKDGMITEFEISPEDVGLPRACLKDLQGGDSAVNARAVRELLSGKHSAYRDAVLLNSGAALCIAGIVADVNEGVERAAQAVDEGKAKRTLEGLVACSNLTDSGQENRHL